MTNEEWFTSLSTGEKAKFLGRAAFCDFCPYQLTAECSWKDGDCAFGDKDNVECFEMWLKAPHKEEHK